MTIVSLARAAIRETMPNVTLPAVPNETNLNPSRHNLGQREKNNLNLYFHTSFWYLKRFHEGLKGLINFEHISHPGIYISTLTNVRFEEED